MMDLAAYRQQLDHAAQFLTEKVGDFPRIGIITGTGLGCAMAAAEQEGSLDYDAIPDFPVSTVSGHHGRLLWGTLSGRRVLVLQGRFHLYEGYAPSQIAFPIRALARCGLRDLIITNAAGGLNPEFETGDLMLLGDHINMTGENALVGPHSPDWGPRFPDMSAVYDPQLQALALEKSHDAELPLKRGVYVGVKGPSLETPAEIALLRMIGSDAVGMSTVQEAIAGAQAGLRMIGISVITNMNLADAIKPTSLDAVIEAAEAAAPKLSLLIHMMLEDWPASP